MNVVKVVKCVVDGCDQGFRTSEAVSEVASFLCRNHAPKMPPDLAPKFQDTQFDDFHFPRSAVTLLDEKNQETESDILNPTKRHVESHRKAS